MPTIKYSVAKSNMPPLKAEGVYVPHVHIRGSLGTEDIASRIALRGTTIAKADILAVFDNLSAILEEVILDGWRVNLGGIFEMYASVRGPFPAVNAPYDPAVNTIELNVQAGRHLRDYVTANAQPERIFTEAPAPKVLAFEDLSSATTSSVITPGNIGTVVGLLLKFNPDAPDEGIFLIPVAGGDTVQTTVTQRNTPSELIFLVPTLTPGADYRLEVRARLNDSETLRAGQLAETLEVAPLP